MRLAQAVHAMGSVWQDGSQVGPFSPTRRCPCAGGSHSSVAVGIIQVDALSQDT